MFLTMAHVASATNAKVADTRGSIQEVRTELDELRMRTEKLALVNMALWSLLRDRLGVTDEDLEKRIQEIDLQDGKLDGRAAPGASKCVRCSRMVSHRHKRCLYCGAERTVSGPNP
jgi:hypothetical protein